MFCPKCGTPHDEESLFCGNCGNPLPTEPVTFVIPRKGSHRAPLLIMAAMAILGLIFFFLFPSGESPAPPLSEIPWLSHSGGTLIAFDQDQYAAGSQLTIPDTIDGERILRIGGGCFAGCDSLEEVILPHGLVEIQSRAFESCTALRGIYIPETVLHIRDGAFRGCTALEAICISSTVKTMESDALSGCESLKYILFDGTIAQWKALYGGKLPAATLIYCTDGTFQQDAK